MQLFSLRHRPLPETHQRPIADRIDMHVEVPHVDREKLADKRNVENSETIR